MLNAIHKIKKIIYSFKNVYFWPRTFEESSLRNHGTKFFAIVGLPRSGTSIFQNVINQFEECFCLYESSFSPVVINDQRIRHLYFYEYIKQIGHICEQVSGKKAKLSFSFEKDYQYFGDKIIYGSSLILTGALKKAVRKRRIHKTIFIVRDPRAIYSSYKKWMNKRNEKYPYSGLKVEKTLVQEMNKWNEYVTFVIECVEKFDCLMVRYEDLASEELRVVSSILEYLELEVDPEMLGYEKLMHDNSLGAWRHHLHKSEIAEIQDICRNNMTLLGYN